MATPPVGRSAIPGGTSSAGGSTEPLVPRALDWARARIDAAEGPIPTYGSAEWAALPDDSRTKIAAVIIAAECWRVEVDPAWIAWRQFVELNPPEEPAVWSPEIVEQVRRSANRPSFAELSRRRGEPEAEARAVAHERRMEGLMTRG